MRIKNFQKGELIYKDGDPGNEMLIILTGSVSVFKMINAEKVDLAVHDRGDFIGEMSLLLDAPRSANVQALDDCEAEVLNKNEFLDKIQNDPQFALRMITDLADRVDQLHDVITNIQGVKKGYEIMYGIKKAAG